MQLETEPPVPQQDRPLQGSRSPHTRGLLFVLSAPSGTGKDSVISGLKTRDLDFHVVASVTTRSPRPGESEGNPYHFVSKESFEHMIAHDELLEYANVHGNWYGQPIGQIKQNLSMGRDVLLKIDVQGAETVRRKVPGAIFIFLTPGSMDELALRLQQRDTETDKERERRLNDARSELAQRDKYDYMIVNRQDHLSEAVEHLRAIMLAEHCRTRPRYVEL
jgi:guanylate kinase